MAKKMTAFDIIAVVLLIAGGLNWGLVQWFNFDLVTFISFGQSWLEATIKSGVALSAIYSIFRFFTL